MRSTGSTRSARRSRRLVPVAAAVLCLLTAQNAWAYSALAHEAIIDAAWDGSIVPALRARFHPQGDELQRARAFAYGGSLIQDIGYYPFSSRFFGNLTHYVRSGDFVEALIRDSTDVNEYAFALGALAHYAADNDGHPLAVNRAVPVLYPKLRSKFGNLVSYEQNPAAHLKTEFGFDVVQVARGQYATAAYHNFIGFEVSKPVMERAFRETYGLELKHVFSAIDMSIGTFRWTVSTTIPGMTKVAWELKQKDIAALNPGATRESFTFSQTRAEYERQFGTEYKRPALRHKILAGLLRVVPRFGPFKPLAFEPPTPQAEAWFFDSFRKTVEYYRSLVVDASRSQLAIANRNFDTGAPTKPGAYSLADETYAELVKRLAKDKDAAAQVPSRLLADVKAFYANPAAPIETKKHKKDWKRVLEDLGRLQSRN